jgi:hypothetical protein
MKRYCGIEQLDLFSIQVEYPKDIIGSNHNSSNNIIAA